jgi:hypothetical protein
MNTKSQTTTNSTKILWHITVDIAYEGGENDSCQEGVRKVLSALTPLIENGSSFKQVFITRLPEKD